MQQRRGTAAEWTSADPVLAAGEIGYETDTGRFKFGDGVTAWSGIEYYSSADSLIDGAPELLDTLNELAAALGDDENFSTNVIAAINTKASLTADTAENLALVDPLGQGVFAYDSTNQKFKIGDGGSSFADLPYVATEEYVDVEISNVVGQVTAAEISTLSGVSSNIQDQIDASNAAISENATDIGVLQGDVTTNTADLSALEPRVSVNETDIAGANSNIQTLQVTVDQNVLDIASNVTAITGNSEDIDALQTSVGLLETEKAPTNSPTFTGNVVLPQTTAVGTVTSAEIEHLSGVTSSIQTQIDGKLATSVASSTYAPLEGATLTGTVSLPATTSIGDVSAAELGHVSGVTSGIQGQIDAKAPLESPTFTGTVSGVSASMIGLSNVDNTSDSDKPVSTAAQTALNSKLDLAGGTMTGKITLDGDPTQALHAVTKQYVDSVEAGLITRPSVKAATTGNLSGTYDNGIAGVGATLNLGQLVELSIDGVDSWSQYNGILVKNQTNKFENGRYVVEQIGNDVDTDWILRRCSLCDEADEIPGSYTFVLDGTINEQTGWVQHVANPETFTVGTDDIDVYQFAGAGSVTAGTNISVTGSQVSVVDSPVFAGIVNASAAGVEFSDGVQTQAGVPSLTSFAEKTTSYTLDTFDHKDNVVEMNSASAVTFTIPANATLDWPIGASMDIFQTGSGQVTISPAAGVALNFTPGNKLRTQWSSATIMKRAADSWVLYGDLTA